jgi:tellurite resistance protein
MTLVAQLKAILASNSDGHLSIHECLVIRRVIEALEARATE